tara:strand:- start:2848 stop:3441 length:594 start_codon:yes stop_codon:yes gene_type:complete
MWSFVVLLAPHATAMAHRRYTRLGVGAEGVPLQGALAPVPLALDALMNATVAAAAGATPSAADAHQPFTAVLFKVRASLTNVTHDVETVEQSADSDAAHSATLQEHMQLALHEIEQGIGSLRRVRGDVAASAKLLPAVKTQVLWDLDKMTEDVQRLHASGLAPGGRAALLKALQLRFAVLLSPSFWRSPIRRSLISG